MKTHLISKAVRLFFLTPSRFPIFTVLICVLACEGPEGQPGLAGKTSLIRMLDEGAGSNCAFGGIRINTGIDTNGDGELSDDEVVSSKYVCTMANGRNSLSKVYDEQAGSRCSNGGVRIEVGIDENINNSLDAGEVMQTTYLCHGTDGKNSLTEVTPEPAGLSCEHGGNRLVVGLDINSNSVLEANEITQTRYVCNGKNAISTLTVVSDEPVGQQCVLGGVKIQTGLDSNANLLLDNAEIQSTRYVCTPGTGNDKQVRIDIAGPALANSTTDWKVSEFASQHLIKFNKMNYSNVDSITFVPSLVVYGVPLGAIPNAYVYADLYNITDGQSIANSEVSAFAADHVFKESRNIFDQLPSAEKIYGIRTKSGTAGVSVGTGYRSFLIVYKH